MVGVAKVDEAEEKWAFADQPVVEFVYVDLFPDDQVDTSKLQQPI